MRRKISIDVICNVNETDAFIIQEIQNRLFGECAENRMFTLHKIKIEEFPREFHWYEDMNDLFSEWLTEMPNGGYCPGYAMTKNAINTFTECIYSDQSAFVSTETLDNGYIIYLHFANGSEPVKIEYGQIDATDREIKRGLNLEKLLLNGEFGELKY